MNKFQSLNEYLCVQVGKIKNLLSLIPDFVEKEVLYPYLMKCHGKTSRKRALLHEA